jgi:hypothetical protein
LIGISAAAAATLSLAAVMIGLTASATSPPSAFAAAKRALAATAAAVSGTMTMTATGSGGSVWTIETTRWNGNEIAISSGPRHLLGLNRQLLLIGAGAYVQKADGTWLHYARQSDLGPKLGPAAQLARDNVTGTTAQRILKLAANLHKIVESHGMTNYTGTIPNSNAYPANEPTDDAIMRMISNLRSGTPPGDHGGLQLRMIAGGDGMVRRITITFQRYDPATSADLGTTTWNVTYGQLGSTSAITAPEVSTPGTPGVVPNAGRTRTIPGSAPAGG